jgi:preprotein translocase subunit SecF
MYTVRYKHLFITIGLAIVAVCALIIAVFGVRPGIDFTGGSLTEVRYERLPEKALLEQSVAVLAIGDFSVRQSKHDGGGGYLVTTRDLTVTERSELEAVLVEAGEGAQVVRFTSVGPVIGAELANKAVWAILAVLLIIVCYVALAFAGIGKPVGSWVYGFMTIAMLGHDIIVPFAVMSLLGYFAGVTVDILFVTALLTILGFSVNDTIVIFDRVREKLKLHRTEHKRMVSVIGGMPREEITYTLHRPFGQLVGEAIDETTARSVNTSLAVLLSLVALYFFGGEVTEMFVLILMVGVIAGAYSSMFIAAPLLVVYEEWQAKRMAAALAVSKK